MLKTFVAAAVLLAVLPAAAQDCPDQSQDGLSRCADTAYKQADAALNATYKQIIERLKDDADTTKSLVAAQRAWIAYRDAECDFITSGAAGGTIRPMLQTMCLEQVTTKRVDELKPLLECEEGDLSCPVPAP
ncbi:MAG TPA: lysozyme inhibitor LprI family protein [Inquilinus sp.]|nr:lysozyme inhibitor LprI family protein [Inquilinus sp.]